MWEIEAKSGMGPLKLGMTAAQANSVIGQSFRTFKRVPESTETIHAYDDACIHLTCSEDGVVKIISGFQPRKVSYAGIQLLGRAIQDVVAELDANDITSEKEDAGYWVSQAGILLVEVDGIVDGIELYPA